MSTTEKQINKDIADRIVKFFSDLSIEKLISRTPVRVGDIVEYEGKKYYLRVFTQNLIVINSLEDSEKLDVNTSIYFNIKDHSELQFIVQKLKPLESTLPYYELTNLLSGMTDYLNTKNYKPDEACSELKKYWDLGVHNNNFDLRDQIYTNIHIYELLKGIVDEYLYNRYGEIL
jgi:hypothetical protein